MIDFDGDCLSDLFMTVVDTSTGKTYYEIYLRRENEIITFIEEDFNSTTNTTSNGGSEGNYFKGLNSFCLVSREEVPS